MLRSWYGRLGNNLIQLANVQYLAQRLGGAACSVPPHDFLQADRLFAVHRKKPYQFMQAEHKLIAKGALLSMGGWAYELVNNFGNPEEYQSLSSVCRDFFFKSDTFPAVLEIGDYRKILRDDIWPTIPYQDNVSISEETFSEETFSEETLAEKILLEETLVIHMRGGDIFSECPHPAYTQPPLSFYEAAIRQCPTSKIVVVTQDTCKNPCLAALLNRYPDIRLQSGSLQDDVSTLLRAKYLVAGTGTFAIALAFCSRSIQTLYLPILDINRKSGSVKRVPSIWNPVNIFNAKATLDFEVVGFQVQDYTAIGSWSNSDEQRALMISHAANKIIDLSK
ncbi:MAG: hypothetical protein AAF152_06175 [Cyanobacteria bacterium P01_A01_bin.114]